MVTWLVDGNALAGAINVSVGGASVAVEHRLLRGSTWRPPVSARNAVVEVPGRHGSVVSGMASFEPPTVTLVGSLSAPSEHALEAALARLQGLLSRPAGVTLTRTSGLVTATARARLMSWSQGDAIAKGAAPARSDWTAVLTVPGVFFTEAPTASPAAPASGTVAFASLAGSSAPVSPVVRIKGPATAVTVTDPQSGTGWTWTGSTLDLATEYLYLYPDFRAHITVSASAWAGASGLHTAGLSYPAAGGLRVWPRVSGASTVVELDVTVTGGDGNNTITVWAGRSFL